MLGRPGEKEVREEKVNQIRIYSGDKYELVNEVQAGSVCAVTGLNHTHPGEGLVPKRRLRPPYWSRCSPIPSVCRRSARFR